MRLNVEKHATVDTFGGIKHFLNITKNGKWKSEKKLNHTVQKMWHDHWLAGNELLLALQALPDSTSMNFCTC